MVPLGSAVLLLIFGGYELSRNLVGGRFVLDSVPRYRPILMAEISMGSQHMRTGQVAVQAGVNVQTLRYYERRGILPAPRRALSGYRQYPPVTVRLIRFVKRAQELGFTLDEVAELLRLRESRPRSRSRVRSSAAARLREIEQKIQRLEAMRQALGALIDSCACGGTPECPILESLENEGALS